ncbi:unnamed protein product [Brachionus calyciflorus]|uniref:C2H2-type domain-containing protein n=1 Tax=Brachionus calyciflorus TaxID=104777 RepID=A0A813WK16_9BILA|nr:unnamed protein product [Brachionus calyciflorus]
MFKHRLNEYTCVFCGFKSTLKGAVILHQKSIHKDLLESDRNDFVHEDKDLKNEIVNFESYFKNVGKKRKIDPEKELYVCGSCYFISKNRDYIHKHFKTDHKFLINLIVLFSNDEIYLDVVKNGWCLNKKQCSKCSFIGEKSCDLKEHKKKFHNFDTIVNDDENHVQPDSTCKIEVKNEDCIVSEEIEELRNTLVLSSYEKKKTKSGVIKGVKMYTCPFCSFKKSNRLLIKKHLEKHLDSESKFKRLSNERELNKVLDDLKNCVVKAINLINKIENS